MFKVLSFVVPVGLALCIFHSHETMAQQSGESGVVYEAARNKIGLIRYCRKAGLLDQSAADQAVTTVEAGLSGLPSDDTLTREQGDRAQQAGEDGFWEAGRRRDVASIANLFHTTPAELCQEWAGETVRAQAMKPYREVKTITIEPPRFAPSFPQSAFEPDQSTQVDTAKIAAAAGSHSASLPPLPERAPLAPPEAEFASLQNNPSTDSYLPPAERAAKGYVGAAAITAPRALREPPDLTAPLPKPVAAKGTERLPLEEAVAQPPREQTVMAAAAVAPAPREQPAPAAAAVAPPPGEQTVAAAGMIAPSPRDEQAVAAAGAIARSPGAYDRPHSLGDVWPFNRIGNPRRCLMPGCKWKPSAEKRPVQ